MVKDIRLGDWLHIDDHEDGSVTVGNDSNTTPNVTYNRDGTVDIENLSVGSLDSDSVESPSVNGVEWVSSTDSIQDVADSVAANDGAVALYPNETYNEGSEIVLPKGVTLLGNGAQINITGDHNGIFLDNHCKILGFPYFKASVEGYSSHVIELNTNRNTDNAYGYSSDRDTVRINAHVDIQKDSDGSWTAGSTCLYLGAHGRGIYAVQGNVSFRGGGKLIHADLTDDGFCNSNWFHGSFTGGLEQFKHTNDGTKDQACATQITGVVQTSYKTTRHFVNTSEKRSWQFFGDIWDSGYMPSSGSIVEGDNIKIFLLDQRNLTPMQSVQNSSLDCQGSIAQAISDRGGTSWINLQSNVRWEIANTGPGGKVQWQYMEPGSSWNQMMSIGKSGNLTISGTLTENGSP